MILDWLSFTLPNLDGLELAHDLLGGVIEREKGFRGYTVGWHVLGTGVIGWNPAREDMGLHYSLPGDALRLLEECNPGWDWRGFLIFLTQDLHAKMARVDWALDDRDEILDLATIRKATEDEKLVTRWRTALDYEAIRGLGHGITYGRRGNPTYLRIYDKQLEQMQHGQPDPGPWVRVELETKGKAAQAAVARFIAQPDCIAGIINGLIRFTDPLDQEPNQTRRKTAEWWLKFITTPEIIRLTGARTSSTIERKRAWLLSQVAHTLAVVFTSEKDGEKWLRNLLETGNEQWTNQDSALLLAHLHASKTRLGYTSSSTPPTLTRLDNGQWQPGLPLESSIATKTTP